MTTRSMRRAILTLYGLRMSYSFQPKIGIRSANWSAAHLYIYLLYNLYRGMYKRDGGPALWEKELGDVRRRDALTERRPRSVIRPGPVSLLLKRDWLYSTGQQKRERCAGRDLHLHTRKSGRALSSFLRGLTPSNGGVYGSAPRRRPRDPESSLAQDSRGDRPCCGATPRGGSTRMGQVEPLRHPP